MAEGHGAVEGLAGHEVGGGSADDVAAANDDTMLALGFDIVALEEGADALGSGGDESFLAEDHASDVYRGEAVNILVGRDGVDDLLLVDMLGQRELDDETVNLVVVVEEVDDLEQFGFVDIFGKTIDGREESDLGAGFLFVGDIGLAGAVVADEDGGEMRRTASVSGYLADFVCNLVFYL